MIFGVGLSKTGTTSLFAALDQLGYRSGTYRHLRQLGLEDWWAGRFDTDYLAGYDAVTDLPVATFFVQLDERYPDSKFVLTVRDVDSWVTSAASHFATEPTSAFGRDVRLATYGSVGFHERRFRRAYTEHVRSVQEHFADRPGRLLTMDIVGGDGWEVLCPFLGCPVPVTPFPHVQPGHRLPGERPADAWITADNVR